MRTALLLPLLAASLGVPALAQLPAPAAPAASLAPAASPEAVEKLELAKAIVGVIMPPEQRNALSKQLIDGMIAQIRTGLNQPNVPANVRQVVEKRMAGIPAMLSPVVDRNLPKLADAMAQAYASEFSLAELGEIRAFSKSPAGAHYLARASALQGHPVVVRANQAFTQELNAASARFRADVDADVRALQPKAAPAPAKPGKR